MCWTPTTSQARVISVIISTDVKTYATIHFKSGGATDHFPTLHFPGFF